MKAIKKLRKTYHKDNFLSMTMEESGELIQACNKYRRSVRHKKKNLQVTSLKKKDAFNNLKEEIVDVEIAIELLKESLDISDKELKKIKHGKLKKALKRVKWGYYV